MRELRKINDIWKAVDDKFKTLEINKLKWKQSYEGVKSAIEYIGLTMITTKEEFYILEIPMDKKGKKHYGSRTIEVSKNGITRKAEINNLLSGNNSLRTVEEIAIINIKKSIDQSLVRPKGIATNNNSESKAIDDLDILIGISDYTHRKHLVEHRLYDMAYCMIDDEVNESVFVADQIKSSKVDENGSVSFHESSGMLTVNTMISILENGSLTCIGQKRDGLVDVVWFFYGINAINILHNFTLTQTFRPILYPMKKSSNEFTIVMNSKLFRFDVGKSLKECHRLLEKRIEFIKIGTKHSLIFWNEDDSQIPCENHRIEQHSFNMTRSVCQFFDINIERRHDDSYGPIDFIINGIIRVQDKAGSTHFKVRRSGRFGGGIPYNPDDIDIFQISDLVNNIVYAIPMRVITDNVVISFFTAEQLMKYTIRLSIKWKNAHKQFKHDFKTEEGMISYVAACETASKIPQLTDRNFYTNMIDINKDKFGSKRQLAARKVDT